MFSDRVDPGGEVRGCSLGCILGMSDVSPFVWIQLAGPYREFPYMKKCFGVAVFLMRRDSFMFGLAQNRSFVSAPLHEILKAMPHTAHRRSLLSAARSRSSRRHLARSSAVHVESSYTMHSRKAQSRAPPDSPEIGYI